MRANFCQQPYHLINKSAKFYFRFRSKNIIEILFFCTYDLPYYEMVRMNDLLSFKLFSYTLLAVADTINNAITQDFPTSLRNTYGPYAKT